MKRRDVAFMLAALNVVAATILELCGFNPHDQVLFITFFGINALLWNDEPESRN